MRDERVIRRLLRMVGATRVHDGILRTDVAIREMSSEKNNTLRAELRCKGENFEILIDNRVSATVPLEDLLDILWTEIF